MKKIVAIILVVAASGIFVSSAFAYNSLVYHLAKYGCDGQSSYVKNGCYAYLDPRILEKKSPGGALDACKRQCNDWFGYSDDAAKKCYVGCTFLNNKE